MPMVQRFSDGVLFWQDEPHVQEIPHDAVPADTRALAEDALTVAKAELGLDNLVLRWFSDESETSRRLRQKHGSSGLPWRTFEADAATWGITFGADPDTVWIRSTLDPADAIESVLHESRHVAQYRDFVEGRPKALNMTGSPCSDQLAEVDARQFVRELVAAIEAEGDAYRQSQAAVAAHQPAPVDTGMSRRSRFFEHKGRTSCRCDHCEEIVPIGVTHRCPKAHSWRPS